MEGACLSYVKVAASQTQQQWLSRPDVLQLSIPSGGMKHMMFTQERSNFDQIVYLLVVLVMSV
jgi:hypothetical protein